MWHRRRARGFVASRRTHQGDNVTFSNGPGVSYVRAGEGPASWLVGDTYTVKATSESTGGAFGLLEASVPPGGGPPPHVHTREDEAFYLLDGILEVTAGEASMPPAHCSGRRRVVSSASSPRPGRPHAGASRRRRSTRRGSAALPNCRCVTAPKSKPRRAFPQTERL